jgi:DnaJ-class molecular chaperone
MTTQQTEINDRQCPDCDGEGEYSFPEAAWAQGDDGWYKCDRCDGTGRVPLSKMDGDADADKP